MNYLGHLLLSRDHEPTLIGNFLADRLNSGQQKELPEVYQPGITFHRWIDHTTDNHPLVKQMVSIIRPIYGRYGPVALDVYMDHLLSRNWDRYSDESWHTFKARVYRTLESHSKKLPAGYNRGIIAMVNHDWLDQYDDYNGLLDVMRRLDKRASHKTVFESGLNRLHSERDRLEELFEPFMRDMQKNSRSFFELES